MIIYNDSQPLCAKKFELTYPSLYGNQSTSVLYSKANIRINPKLKILLKCIA